MKTNRGITERLYSEAAKNVSEPSRARAAFQLRMVPKPTRPTPIMAIATGTRMNSRTTRATIPRMPTTSGLKPQLPRQERDGRWR
jgi:hypothetical protein